MADITVERQAIDAFAREDLRDRLLYFADKPKRRAKLLDAIHTSEFLAPAGQVAIRLPAAAHSRETALGCVLRQMSELGAGPTCYAVSLLSTLDGKTLALGIALQACFMNTVETLLFDPSSRLGYYEGGHANDRFILKPVRQRSV